jgi:hypothetical protein
MSEGLLTWAAMLAALLITAAVLVWALWPTLQSVLQHLPAAVAA